MSSRKFWPPPPSVFIDFPLIYCTIVIHVADTPPIPDDICERFLITVINQEFYLFSV